MKIHTSGGAKSHPVIESRIGRPCALGSMPPNRISGFLGRALNFCKVV